MDILRSILLFTYYFIFSLELNHEDNMGTGALMNYDFVQDVTFQRFDANLFKVISLQSPFNPIQIVMQQNSNIQKEKFFGGSSGQERWQLKFQAFNTSFLFILSSYQDLIHPQATIHIHEGGSSRVTSPLLSNYILEGYVYQDHPSFQANYMKDASLEEQNQLGWARLVIHTTWNNHTQWNEAERWTYLQDHLLFEGSFTHLETLYTIKTIEHYELSKRDMDIMVASPLSRHTKAEEQSEMMIWRQYEDTASKKPMNTNNQEYNSGGCGSSHLWWNREGKHEWLKDLHEKKENQHILNKRATSKSTGCPTTEKILYMGVAADCTYTQNYKGSSGALNQILTDWSMASKIYEQAFNFKLGIVEVNIQQDCSTANNQNWNQACSSSYTIANRLSDFSQWRGQQTSTAGLWHLMSLCNTGSIVGISWESQVCQKKVTSQSNGGSISDTGSSGQAEYVSGTGLSTVIPSEYLVVAHEIGHGIGCVHDCDSSLCSAGQQNKQCCPCGSACDCGGKYIMNPSSSASATTFSPCSISNGCQTIGLLGNCLQDPGSQAVISAQQCGNGIVETGEQCDCGGTALCNGDPCCNATTCQLTAGSKCDPANDLCCKNCQPLSAGTVCRPASSSCSIEQVCPGNSGKCPSAVNVADLTACTTCDGVSAQCASGQCTSRDLQCQIRGGGSTVTGACANTIDSCQLLCSDSTMPSGTCVELSGYFIDGTACGYNGVCQTGQCQQSAGGQIISWIKQNPIWASFIIILALFFLLAGIYLIVKRLCLNRKRRKVNAVSNAAIARSDSRARNVSRTGSDGRSVAYPGTILQNHDRRSMANSGRPSNRVDANSSPSNWVDPRAYNGQYPQ